MLINKIKCIEILYQLTKMSYKFREINWVLNSNCFSIQIEIRNSKLKINSTKTWPMCPIFRSWLRTAAVRVFSGGVAVD